MALRCDPDSIEQIVGKHRHPLILSDPELQRQVQEVLSLFELSGETILKVADVFRNEMEKGLKYDGSSLFMMANTFVYSTLDGTEEGKFLGLDLGGTNFRVVLIELSQGKSVREEVESYELSQDLRSGPGADLFNYIAQSILSFAQKYNIVNEKLPLGFTFSFPMTQSSLGEGFLVKWIGQYSAKDVEGKNIVSLLQEAITKTNALNVDVLAILNDTTGTLLKGSLLDKQTAISFILGTGSNVCFFEKTNRMSGWTGKEEQVALNIEWGPLPDTGLLDFIETKFDVEIDNNSSHPKCFRLEKYIGGHFFGELVRLVLCELIDKGVFLNGNTSGNLRLQQSFKTSFISEIEKDTIEKTCRKSEEILKKLGISCWSEDDVKILKAVCQELTLRTTLLSAACLSEVVKETELAELTIAVDGSLYKYHPRIHDQLTQFTNQLVSNQQLVKFILAEDGSGSGAALLAAIVSKNK